MPLPSFPSSLRGVLEQMGFCPKCGDALVFRNEDPTPWNKQKICSRCEIFMEWYRETKHAGWSIVVRTKETDEQ